MALFVDSKPFQILNLVYSPNDELNKHRIIPQISSLLPIKPKFLPTPQHPLTNPPRPSLLTNLIPHPRKALLIMHIKRVFRIKLRAAIARIQTPNLEPNNLATQSRQ